jgi:hypothetical protein
MQHINAVQYQNKVAENAAFKRSETSRLCCRNNRVYKATTNGWCGVVEECRAANVQRAELDGVEAQRGVWQHDGTHHDGEGPAGTARNTSMNTSAFQSAQPIPLRILGACRVQRAEADDGQQLASFHQRAAWQRSQANKHIAVVVVTAGCTTSR